MILPITLGVLAGLLVASVLINVFQYVTSRRAIEAANQHEQRLLDRARAAELRSHEQIDAMLARVSTAPRLDLSEGQTKTAIDPSERTFISDDPTDDEVWNDFLGEDPDEDLS